MENKIKTVGLSRRFLAYYIDTFLLLIPAVGALYYIALSSNNLNALFINFLYMVAFVLFPQTFLNILYFVLLQHNFGATLGQMFAGYQIIDKDGKKLSFQILFFRQTVGKIASASLFGLGIYSIIKHPQKRAWHDEMVGSIPVSKHNSWPFAIFVLVFIISINAYLVYLSFITFSANDSLHNDIKNTVTKFQTMMTSKTKSSEQTNIKFNQLIDDARQNYYKGDFNKQLELSRESLIFVKTDYEKAIALYWSGLAKYKLAAKGDKSDAQADLDQALLLNPNYAGPYVTLAAIEADKGNYQTSLILAQKCAEIDPNYAWCHNSIGLNLLNLGKKEDGIKELEKAVSLDPNSFVFQDNLRRAKLGR